MSRKIKIGVLGVGSLGQHHARIYSEMEGVEFVGVCDVDAKRAQEIAATFKTRAFSSIDEFAGQVEAVSVVVPTDLHHETGSKLIDKGLHLLIEKPIAATTAEAESLVALAKKHNVILQVGHIERFNPVLSFLEKTAAKPRFIEAHRLAPYPPPREGLHPRGTEVSVVLEIGRAHV